MKPFRRAALAAAIALPGFAAAQSLSTEAATFVAVMEQNGCLVTPSNDAGVVEATGLSEDQIYAVVAELYAAGLIVLTDDGNARLTTPGCPG